MERLRNVAFAAALLGGVALATAGTASAKDGFVCSGNANVTTASIVDSLQKDGQKILYIGKNFSDQTMAVTYSEITGDAYLIDTEDGRPLEKDLWRQLKTANKVCKSPPITDVSARPFEQAGKPAYLDKLKPNPREHIDLASAFRKGARFLLEGRFSLDNGREGGKIFLLLHDPETFGTAYVLDKGFEPTAVAAFKMGGTTRSMKVISSGGTATASVTTAGSISIGMNP